jgi:hypothetical protein
MMNVRARGRTIFAFFQQHRQGTLQQAAEATGMSRSAAYRQRQAMTRRNQHPESWLWETEEGMRWLVLLMCATLYIFGIRGGVGMETIAEFFLLIRINTHVGVSPTSLCRMMAHIEEVILQYQHHHVRPNAKGRQVIVGADETFFKQVMLVMLDLCSGYILLEETADDRTFATWQERARRALDRIGATVRYMVSDQAKALTKLALQELQCQHIPDLFHATHELTKLVGARLATKAASLHRKMLKVQLHVEWLREQGKAPEHIAVHEQALADLRAAHTVVIEGQTRYYEAVHALSSLVHPFSLKEQRSQRSGEVVTAVTQTLETFQVLVQEYEIADSKQRLHKVAKQVPALAAVIDLWWLWVAESLAAYGLLADLITWLCEWLLPSVYWERQMRRTSPGPLRKLYQEAALRAQQRLQAHPLSGVLAPQERARWHRWAVGMVGKFQRTSSAVEGRNGVLSRMNHTQRSIRPRRLKVATVIHNFGIRREDGTTAAERLFGEKFPDLFAWIVEHMGELPLPRSRVACPS